ncbi:hypothetical protein AYO20_07234 [Fonsecaea nubica]|uniref:VOC domain-containing protein n=1 Tax=Fonsecaea nubica TaxID=856822 RepID=A0A178CUN8_9EURO|nr:hypothetical protein AYO20_07234 [Fonsecaea nubica]OAL33548.1 hypothetical protein AYO20_07234 [Fonsecaea nubica]
MTANNHSAADAADQVDPAAKILPPKYLAHVVLRTANFRPMVDFWATFLGGSITYGNDKLAFITYDEEHHRVAILNLPESGPKDATSSGLADKADPPTEHVAFGFSTIDDLALAYTQRKARGIVPGWCVNHGPTTSLYYKDPDGNKIEMQVDNFATVQEATAFFHTDEFAENPIGVDFDPDELVRRLRDGEDRKEILKRPRTGPRLNYKRY